MTLLIKYALGKLAECIPHYMATFKLFFSELKLSTQQGVNGKLLLRLVPGNRRQRMELRFESSGRRPVVFRTLLFENSCLSDFENMRNRSQGEKIFLGITPEILTRAHLEFPGIDVSIDNPMDTEFRRRMEDALQLPESSYI